LRIASYLRYLYLAYFSKPAGERLLYRAIRRTGARRILEIGIGDLSRTLRMIDLAQRFSSGESVRYAAIDLFETRGPSDGQKLSLKQAHRMLKPTGAQVQLIPGDPAQALARAANSLPNVDLLLISAGQTDAAMAGAWFYFPRMLHDASAVYRETSEDGGATALAQLAVGDIQLQAGGPRRRAA